MKLDGWIFDDSRALLGWYFNSASGVEVFLRFCCCHCWLSEFSSFTQLMRTGHRHRKMTFLAFETKFGFTILIHYKHVRQSARTCALCTVHCALFNVSEQISSFFFYSFIDMSKTFNFDMSTVFLWISAFCTWKVRAFSGSVPLATPRMCTLTFNRNPCIYNLTV